MIGPALILALQSTAATAIDPAPLAVGRWVLRRTEERGTGSPAVSATLLSDDEAVRLIVRCDIGYDRTVSLQLRRNWRSGPDFALPVSLVGADGAEPFDLDWEQSALGVFARDAEDDLMVSLAAAALAAAPGRLRLASATVDGRQVTAEFDNRAGRDQVSRVLEACAPDEAAAVP